MTANMTQQRGRGAIGLAFAAVLCHLALSFLHSAAMAAAIGPDSASSTTRLHTLPASLAQDLRLSCLGQNSADWPDDPERPRASPPCPACLTSTDARALLPACGLDLPLPGYGSPSGTVWPPQGQPASLSRAVTPAPARGPPPRSV